ncbi:helix-turn-helix domain-containing protein [Nocardia heshunensis]
MEGFRGLAAWASKQSLDRKSLVEPLIQAMFTRQAVCWETRPDFTMFHMELRELHDDINRAVGDELRAARARRDLTRPQLAEASGVAISTIQRFENGERSPDMHQLFALCNALDISPLEIMDRAVRIVKGSLSPGSLGDVR